MLTRHHNLLQSIRVWELHGFGCCQGSKLCPGPHASDILLGAHAAQAPSFVLVHMPLYGPCKPVHIAKILGLALADICLQLASAAHADITASGLTEATDVAMHVSHVE